MEKQDITLAITAHREGLLLHKTIQGARQIVARARQHGLTVHALIVGDSCNEETKSVIEANKDFFQKIEFVSYSDPGESRNHAAHAATTEYLTFLDGDDFHSPDWIIQCHQFLKNTPENENLVLHPSLTLTFERGFDYFIHIDQEDPAFNWSVFLEHNPFVSVSFSKTSNYRAVPYRKNTKASGFAFEDWLWNVDIAGSGYIHKLVPKTAYFYRKKHTGSFLESQRSIQGTIQSSKLFDQLESLQKRGPLADAIYWRYLHQKKFPQWLTESFKDVSEHEIALYPTSDLFHRYHSYMVTHSEGLNLYTLLYEKLKSKNWDFFFFAPWIKRGGADLGTILHINALVEAGKKVVLFTTEDSDSTWFEKLSPQVETIELGKVARGLLEPTIINMLLRVILQLKPKAIHNINSRICWDLFSLHGLQIKQNTTLYASLYAEDRTRHENAPGGYAISHLEKAWTHLTSIISDNTVWPGIWSKRYGIPSELFKTVNFPSTHPKVEVANGKTANKKILWASRIDMQKQPEILVPLSYMFPDVEFHVYGDAIMDNAKDLVKNLKETPNIHYKGAFNGFQSIAAKEEFDGFLYTSLWDGIPNIILEVISAGMPLVSAHIGGLAEILNDQNAYLVKDPTSVQSYGTRIRELLEDKPRSLAKARLAQTEVLSIHSHENFIRQMKAVPRYWA